MDPKELKIEIDRVVDRWVSEVLKSRFLQKPSNVPERSLWDKFKQGMTNWWWGPKGDKWNPYVWRNRFGDELGVTESFNPSVFSLKEYAEIKSVVEGVESTLNEENKGFDNLRLMKIVKSAADELKNMLFNALNGRVESRSSAQPQVSAAASAPQVSAAPAPEASGSASKASVKDDTEVMSGSRPKSKPDASDAANKGDDGESDDSPETTSPPIPTPQASNASSVPIGGGRKTNRAKIEEAAEEISKMDGSERSKIIPSNDWLSKGGSIKKEKLAHALAWMVMKPHVDPLDAESVKEELKKSLGVDVDLGIPGSSKGVLRKYLEDTLFGNFENVMAKLGIEAKPKEDKRSESKREKETDSSDIKTREAEPPSGTKGEEKAKEIVQKEDGDELSRYFQDGKKERPIKESITLILGFLKHFGDELGTEKRNALAKWWEDKRRELKEIYSPKDQRDSLIASLVDTDSYIDQISAAVGLDSSSVKTKMIEYIREKSS